MSDQKVKKMKYVKFSTQIDAKVLNDLKEFVKQTGKKTSEIVTEALESYLKGASLKPEFRQAMGEVLGEHVELFKKLAKGRSR